MERSRFWIKFCLLSALLLLGLFLLPPQSASAQTSWYVAPGGNDAHSCLSPAEACATIRAAIQKASPGDQIMVLAGTYSNSSGEIFPINLPAEISLIGSSRDSTIISGNAWAAVIYINGEAVDFSFNTVIRDMTIQNGSKGVELYGSQLHTVSPSLVGLRIRWNDTGIYIDSGAGYADGGTVTPVISDTLVASNTHTGIYMRAYGYFEPSTVAPTIVNSTVQSNGLYGIHTYGSSVGRNDCNAAPHIINSKIINNASHGIYAQAAYQGWTAPKIEQSLIEDNSGYGLYYEPDVNGGNFTGAITNTVITSNVEGGIYLYSNCCEPGNLRVTNSNIQNNGQFGIYWRRSTYEYDVMPIIVNSILWNPGADDLYSTKGAWSTNEISYSDIRNGDLIGQAGNFSDDPLFLDKYHISACSPAVDAGTSIDIPPIDIDGDPRPLGSAPDVGADEQPAALLFKTDKQVSSSQANMGDSLTYTITLTPNLILTPLNLTLTDALPFQLSEPASLWASDGAISHVGNQITWEGSITSIGSITMGFNADVIAGYGIARNRAFVDAGLSCMYHSQYAKTAIIAPQNIFLPLAHRAIPSDGIYGTVTENGSPAAGVLLDLRFYDGTNWSTRVSTTTGSDGSYHFLNVPGLYAGQYYYVRYQNPSENYNSRLWTWHTQSIGSYFSGSDYRIGDFDIKDIYLISPSNAAVVSVPTTFYWTLRSASPSDSYEFNLYDPYYGYPYFYTDPPLGYVGAYTLTYLRPGFIPYEWYVWEMWVYSPDGGYGISYWAYWVAFTNQNLEVSPPDMAAPPRTVPDLEPRPSRKP